MTCSFLCYRNSEYFLFSSCSPVYAWNCCGIFIVFRLFDAGKSNVFFQKQFVNAMKLYGNLVCWHDILNEDLLSEKANSSLLNKYLLLAIRTLPPIEAANKCIMVSWAKYSISPTLARKEIFYFCSFLDRFIHPRSVDEIPNEFHVSFISVLPLYSSTNIANWFQQSARKVSEVVKYLVEHVDYSSSNHS